MTQTGEEDVLGEEQSSIFCSICYHAFCGASGGHSEIRGAVLAVWKMLLGINMCYGS